jgi:hypothetical protein
VANPLSVQSPDRDSKFPNSVELARRLLAQDLEPGISNPELVAVGLRKTCARTSAALRNVLGADGCSALLVRALARTQGRHPLIADLRRSSEANVSFDGLVKSVDEYGVVPVAAAIQALLAALIDILVRLIGEEMTVRLIAAEAAPQSAANGGASKS